MTAQRQHNASMMPAGGQEWGGANIVKMWNEVLQRNTVVGGILTNILYFNSTPEGELGHYHMAKQ